MIQVVRDVNTERAEEYSLVIDGRRIEDVFVEFHGGNPGEGGVYGLRTFNPESFRKLTSYTFNDFPDYRGGSGYEFPLLDIIFDPPPGEIGLITRIVIREEEIECISMPNLAEWNKPYSFLDYCEEFSQLAKPKYGLNVHYDNYQFPPRYDNALWIRFRYSTAEGIIQNYTSPVLSLIRKIHEEIEKHLTLKVDEKSVVASFTDFPKEVRTYCEQYLMYFIQFLQDLGVDATSDIKHEAGRVLFTITPKNEHEALDKIRTALEVYLHLPSSPIGNDPTSEIAIQRLESQVLRFQSDLKLAAAELQAKNVTIEAQQLTINVQKALLHGEIFPAPMKQIGPEKKEEQEENREEFLGGIVALTAYKDKGIEVSWAKIFRHLRNWFKEKDEDEKPSG